VLARRLDAISEQTAIPRLHLRHLPGGLRESLVLFPVYRTYVSGRRARCRRAISRSHPRRAGGGLRNPVINGSLFRFLEDV